MECEICKYGYGTVITKPEELCKTHRELSKFIYASPTELHPFINIFIDNKNVKDLLGLNTPLETNSVIRILPGISGG